MMLDSEEAQEETQEDTESEESEQEVYTDIFDHDGNQLEEVEETVVTDDIQVIPSLAQVDVSQIIDNVVEHVVSNQREAENTIEDEIETVTEDIEDERDGENTIENEIEAVTENIEDEREELTENSVEDDQDEGIGTDHSEAAHTDSDSAKGEDDSIDRSDYGDSEARSDEDCAHAHSADDNAISRSSESLIDHETSSFQPTCPCLESVPA